jgi:hypothetical protein
MHRFISVVAGIGLLLATNGVALAGPPAAASGTFAVSAITHFALRPAGAATFIEQRTEGVVWGTLSGTFEDELQAVVTPSGLVIAQGTMTCACTIDGKSGMLTLVQVSRGPLEAQTFEGKAIITGGSGAVSGYRGVLDLHGTVDPNGLATMQYSGQVHDQS